jgi:mannose-1-phosphate guanylyltransferase/mannose-6-phosphate isomerase
MTQLLNDLYSRLESVSIDYGIMERSDNIRMVPATFKWSDLGSWAALDEIIEKDKTGNILKGNTIDIGSRNSTVFVGDRLVATIGLKDMVVVDTPDATLVSPKERVQEVRKVVEALKKTNHEEHLIHKTVERPWGSYTVLEKGKGYKIKRVVLKPKARLSLQLHRKRSEHWVVVAGVARVMRENETYLVRTNESTFIPINTKHRLENPKDVPLQIIEVQNGDYVEEDDIVRFSDDYNRI